ncbi:MAG: hypothetical protein RML93_13040, partial [Anaerolineales bacterium]|nr:hypothetical protein [Anaerolineales bacterium]MDW8448201.1 hypothetical protein [Anaerolineales bacterium]
MARILRLSSTICLIVCSILLLVVAASPSFALPQSSPVVYLPLVLKGNTFVPIPPTAQPSPTPSPTQPPPTSSPTYSLRFYGNGVNDIDRVKIPVVSGNTSLPVNIGAADFTIEFWLRFVANQNQSGPCGEGNDTWIYGNIL